MHHSMVPLIHQPMHHPMVCHFLLTHLLMHYSMVHQFPLICQLTYYLTVYHYLLMHHLMVPLPPAHSPAHTSPDSPPLSCSCVHASLDSPTHQLMHHLMVL